ncbi:MAG TPA: LptF/LptG family permease [Armatimonadota bacterium]|jgi:lipopolysaccharide export system permease protein
MRKLDRYLTKEMLGPFLFGMGAFAIVLIGVDLLYEALKEIIQQGLPVGPVLLAMLYRLPQTMVLTLPMAVIFSTLMAFGGLSGNGEIVAMRAGGIGLWRLAIPALVIGLLVSVLSLGLNGWLVPYANQASNDVLLSVQKSGAIHQKSLTLRMPSSGPPDRVLWAEDFDPAAATLKTLIVWEFSGGQPKQWFSATSATWAGDTWVLRGVDLVQQVNGERIETHLDRLTYQLGKSPWELGRGSRKLQDMSMKELLQLADLNRLKDTPLSLQALEEYNMRMALPWAALGLALIGLPLGIRPQRTSTGVGLGISLAIILAYYIIVNMMRILGQQGTLPPGVADWIPNVLLYTIGLGLLVNASN